MIASTGVGCRRTAARSILAVPLLLSAGCGAQGQPAVPPDEFLEAGERALDWTRRFVEIGPRPAGSAALAQQKEMIVAALSELSCTVEEDEFVAATPIGALRMCNIVARFGADSPEAVVVVSGHYDTLRMEGFLGANDGGSSAGALMALAERLDLSNAHAVWLAFFDGEEATVEWRDRDHTYGSRRLAGRWAASGIVPRIRALINVDMVGDADLELLYEGNSDRRLRATVWGIANELGYGTVFGRSIGYIQDDHVPFGRVGVPILNLIDFNYGDGHAYWHSRDDTLDKLSARSFATVLHVVETAIDRLLED